MPRKYTQTDEGMFVPYAAPDNLVPEGVRQFWTAPTDERRETNRNMPNMFHRVGAGPQDPMGVMWVLDLLQRWNPNFYVRAKYIARAINERQEHYWFEPIAAGKIMSELADIASEEWAERPNNIPIKRYVDYRGQFYLITNEPTTWQWFWKLRVQLMAKCDDIRTKESQGIQVKRIESAWADLHVEP